jgi:hypothetical protein
MKNRYLYIGILFMTLSFLIHITSREHFTDISGNSLPTNLANLLNLISPRIKFNAVDTEPTDITIHKAFMQEDASRLQDDLATKLKKHIEKSLSSNS